MTTITLDSHTRLWGRTGETNASLVSLDVSLWRAAYPDGAGTMLFRRPDGEVYPLLSTLSDNALCAALTDVETAVPGTAYIEAQWTCGGALAKSETFSGVIAAAMGAAGSVPASAPNWIDGLTAIGAQITLDRAAIAADRAAISLDKATVSLDKAAALAAKNDALAAKANAEAAKADAEAAQVAAEAAETNAEAARDGIVSGSFGAISATLTDASVLALIRRAYQLGYITDATPRVTALMAEYGGDPVDVGDILDPSVVMATITFSDGSTLTTSHVEIDASDTPIAEGDNAFTVRYGTAECTLTISTNTLLNLAQELPDAWTAQKTGGEAVAVTLPHTVNMSDGMTASMFRGVVTYTRTLHVDALDVSKRHVLWFMGAGQKSAVSVNGTSVKTYAGGYTPFCADLTGHLLAGDNTLTVSCDNARDADVIPLSADFNFNNGLHRAVKMYKLDGVYLDPAAYGVYRVHAIQSNVSQASATVTVKALLKNSGASASATVKCYLIGTNGTVALTRTQTLTLPSGGEAAYSQVMTIQNPRLWNGKIDPHLYRVRVYVSVGGQTVDTATVRLGLRFFSMDANEGFMLNGVAYPLRGAAIHSDYPNVMSAMTDAQIDADFEQISDLGCTFLRLAHYPHNEHTFDKCDELGIIVQTEIPWVNHCGANASDAYYDCIEENLKSMIKTGMNHASIVFWGLSNELGGSHLPSGVSDPQGAFSAEKATTWNNALYTLAKGLDPSRYVGFTSIEDAFEGNAPTQWSADYIAVNRYDAWYYAWFGGFSTYMDAQKTDYPNIRWALGEYGAGANPDTHSETPIQTTDRGAGGARHDEEFQNLFHEEFLSRILARPWIVYTSIWALYDFAVSGRSEGGLPYINDKGLITRDRATHKDSYYLYKATWSNSPVAYITSRRFITRAVPSITIKAYANTDTLTLKRDGVTLQTKTRPTRLNVVWEFTNVALTGEGSVFTVTGEKGGVLASDSATFNGLYVSIGAQTESVTAIEGSISASLSVTATASDGSAPTYQWYQSATNENADGTLLSGQTEATMALPATLTEGTYYYYCVATSEAAGTAVSAAIPVLVTETPTLTIASHPANASVTTGVITESLTVMATATAGYAIHYQWYSNTADENIGGTPLTGETGATMTIPTDLTSGTYYYYCAVSIKDAGGNVLDSRLSTPVTVTVSDPSETYLARYILTGTPGAATPATILDESGSNQAMTVNGQTAYNADGGMAFMTSGQSLRIPALTNLPASYGLHVGFSRVESGQNRLMVLPTNDIHFLLLADSETDYYTAMKIESSSANCGFTSPMILKWYIENRLLTNMADASMHIAVSGDELTITLSARYPDESIVHESTHTATITGFTNSLAGGLYLGNRADGTRPLHGEITEFWIK